MRQIYHLTTLEAWEKAAGKPYRADSLDSEGFIHCSNADQVARSANRFIRRRPRTLLVLTLDADRQGARRRHATKRRRTAKSFRMSMEPIEPDAVVEICPMRRGPDGKWAFGS